MSRNYMIESEYMDKLPHFKLGIIEADVTCQTSTETLRNQMNQLFEEISHLKVEAISQMPEISAGRMAYRALGKDPTKYRLSAEKLLRRIVKGEGLDAINNIVDLSNMISIQYRAPIGTFDATKLSGDILLHAGREGQSYLSLGNQTLNIQGLPVFSDDLGPFGSTTSDSGRSCVDLETQHIVLTIFGFDAGFDMHAALDYAEALIKDHAMGQITLRTILEDKKRLHKQV